MIIYTDLPRLDLEEAQRFWLTPAEAIRVGGLQEEWGDVRKSFSNMVDRGHLPFRRTGTGKTSPRHFTLTGAIKFSVMLELVDRGRDYECAGVVGDAVTALLPTALQEAVNVADIEAAYPWRVVLYSLQRGKTLTRVIEPVWTAGRAAICAEDLFSLSNGETSAVEAGEFLTRCVRSYADIWSERRRVEGKHIPGSGNA